MKKGIGLFALSLTLVLGASLPALASTPHVNGVVGGIELCPQFICGSAIFAGSFQGQLGFNANANGVIVASLNHTDPLPVAVIDPPADITGGVWEIRTLGRRVSGIVLNGTIASLGDGTFEVNATLQLTGPGQSGYLHFQGILNHNTLIPTFSGVIYEIP